MSKRLEWMHLESTYSDLYTDSWTNRSTRSNENPVAPSGSSLTPPAGAPPGQASPAGKPGAPTAAAGDNEGAEGGNGKRGKKRPKELAEGEPADPEEAQREKVAKKVLSAKWADLKSTKEKMMRVAGEADNLLSFIQNNDGWKWANNDMVMGELKEAFRVTNGIHTSTLRDTEKETLKPRARQTDRITPDKGGERYAKRDGERDLEPQQQTQRATQPM